mmetsp:Transcript_23223/g.33791  ORF Transcript_23223/g.33791 Transcript_23223/m.33791 type:complete len:90 (+) Transcript_23223:366-635(+)
MNRRRIDDGWMVSWLCYSLLCYSGHSHNGSFKLFLKTYASLNDAINFATLEIFWVNIIPFIYWIAEVTIALAEQIFNRLNSEVRVRVYS